AVTWCWALWVWALRRAGRSAPKKYRTDRQDVQSFNSRYTLLSYAMMASDEKKYNTFRRALQAEKRRNGDLAVLEIGCGAYAPFARLCVEEGAKVVAVEGNAWAAARAVFAGLSQQLNVTDLTFAPNVVIMETIGDWAANEYMVSTFLDARHRLRLGDARWIPGQVRTRFAPARMPSWVQGALPPGLWLTSDPRLALSDAATLEFYDFNAFEESMVAQQREASFQLTSAGSLQGFLIWVEVFPTDSAGECLSSLTALDISWSAMLLALPEPLPVETEDILRCKTYVLAAPEPELYLEMPWGQGILRFEWKVKTGARWILPEGQEISFADQPEDVVTPEQEFLWELLGPP
ncbi:unnamed protein product, partial [Effrenium voratum]